MRIRFRGFDNPVVVAGAEVQIPANGQYTPGGIYTPKTYTQYSAPHFHALTEGGILPDVWVRDDLDDLHVVESIYWDLIEE